MGKQLIKTRSEFIDGALVAKEVYITKKVADLNRHNNAVAGWNNVDLDCNPKCRTDLPDGYEMCISGNCIFFPYP